MDLEEGDIRVSTLPGHKEAVTDVTSSDEVERGWIYAPRKPGGLSGEHPYSSRVFGLPKTHLLEHKNAEGEEHLSFLVWTLGFLLGIRLTETEAGFLDATPIKPGSLHDMVLVGPEVERRALGHAERFWKAASSDSQVPRALTAVIHSYWLAQYPPALSFERFTYLYVALDGCHFVNSRMNRKKPGRRNNKQRIAELCKSFEIAVPAWADPSSTECIAATRNMTLHEGLFFDKPLGFSPYGGKCLATRERNTTLEMRKLVSRLLCGILGLPDRTYIKSPINSRQKHGMRL
ncbi:MAG TPA: hypothetical protein VJP77_05100 [Planctomycetota bacterium]|nr:hypothetical protein [Planctomycetota bacterium]